MMLGKKDSTTRKMNAFKRLISRLVRTKKTISEHTVPTAIIQSETEEKK